MSIYRVNEAKLQDDRSWISFPFVIKDALILIDPTTSDLRSKNVVMLFITEMQCPGGRTQN